jgi:hypothetical protein
MNRKLIVAPIAALLLNACVVAPLDYGPGVAVAPALPLIVELGVEPYYHHQGYFYFYEHENARWRFSNSRSGPWIDLPRDRYPRETRYRGRTERWDGRDGRDRDQDRDRDRYRR